MGSKGKAPSIIDDAPWVEKYRPKTLDDVAAHKEIIDTSEGHTKQCLSRSQTFSFGLLMFISADAVRYSVQLNEPSTSNGVFRRCSKAAGQGGSVPTRALLWAPWNWENLHHSGSGTADVWRIIEEYGAGAERLR